MYDPEAFRAVLMPNLHGPELDVLHRQGVPNEHLFAVERSPLVHQGLLAPLPQHAHLLGIQTTPYPMDVLPALDYAWSVLGRRVDLIYLDFFGQPNFTHLQSLRKVFSLRLLPEHGVLILTFGRSRGERVACHVNRTIARGMMPAQAYVDAALEMTGHRSYVRVSNHPYSSDGLPFVTSVFRF